MTEWRESLAAPTIPGRRVIDAIAPGPMGQQKVGRIILPLNTDYY